MSNERKRDLIPAPQFGVTKTGPGVTRILDAMASDALARVPPARRDVVLARRRIGGYEFNEFDYQRVLLWAKGLAITPGQMIRRLEEVEWHDDEDRIHFEVDAGSIVGLVWVTETMGSIELLDDLSIRQLVIRGSSGESEFVAPRLPKLQDLVCSECRFVSMNLTLVPLLTKLWCGDRGGLRGSRPACAIAKGIDG